MTAQERIEAHLRKHEGAYLCASCLAREVGIPPAEGRSIIWRLQALPAFQMRGSRCVSCLHGKRVIRYVGGRNVISAPRQVILFLLTNKEIYLCASCIGFAVEVSLDDVRGVMEYISSLPEFDRREGPCTACARRTAIIAARSTDADCADDLTQMITGTVQHCGWRIDLHSYRVREGWRPFVMVKSSTFGMAVDAPSVLWSVVPTKAEADTQALQAAKDWIDKRSSGRSTAARDDGPR